MSAQQTKYQPKGVLTNFEVYTLLEQQKSENIENHIKVPIVVKEVLRYFEKDAFDKHTEELIGSVVQELRPFTLTKSEVLQIINLRPSSMVDFYVIIEECGDRFSDEQIEAMVEIVAKLPRPEYVKRHFEPIQEDVIDEIEEEDLDEASEVQQGENQDALPEETELVFEDGGEREDDDADD
eukprot:GCRY01000507.1.p1 GENE.GCRY01000507.1~~GCRY01000507.1.p1  ORF type:complete len:181 (+),score=48.65 GCRY01000507.1:328-870(+)